MASAFEKLGVVSFLMMKNPQFRELTLEQVRAITIMPLQKNLLVTATVPGKSDASVPTPVGFATFAKVDDAWDAKLRDPHFDLAEMTDDAWDSGGNKWLVDAVSTQKDHSAFVEKAARAVFPKGGTLHIRLRGADGKHEIGKRKF